MKNHLLTFILLVASVFLTNCAKSSRDSNQYMGTAGVCSSPGYVSTTAGCVPQGNCQVGFGQYGNQCLPMTSNYGIAGGYGYTGGMNYGYGNNGYGYGNGYGTGYGNGSCQAGYIATSIGCLPQQSCPVGYGYSYGNYNGQMGAWCYPQVQ